MEDLRSALRHMHYELHEGGHWMKHIGYGAMLFTEKHMRMCSIFPRADNGSPALFQAWYFDGFVLSENEPALTDTDTDTDADTDTDIGVSNDSMLAEIEKTIGETDMDTHTDTDTGGTAWEKEHAEETGIPLNAVRYLEMIRECEAQVDPMRGSASKSRI